MSVWKLLSGHHVFRRYLTALLIWDLTKWILAAVIPLFLNDRYGIGKEFVSGMVMELLPGIVLGPIVGVWIDRWGAKRMTTLDVLSYSLLIAILPFTQQLWHVQFALLAIGISQTIGSPASLTLRAPVIPKGEEIQGNSLVLGIDRLSKIVGPLLGSLMIIILDYTKVMLICSVMGLLSFVLFSMVHVPERRKTQNSTHQGTGFNREMLRLLFKDRLILGLVITALGYSLTLGILKLYLLTTAGSYGNVELYWGLLLAAQGLGALVGAIGCHTVISRCRNRFSITAIYMVFGLGEAVLLAGLSLPFGLIWSLFILIVAAIFEIMATIIYFSILQSRIDLGMQGRFNSITLPMQDASYMAGFSLFGLLNGAMAANGLLWFGLSIILLCHLPFMAAFFKHKEDAGGGLPEPNSNSGGSRQAES